MRKVKAREKEKRLRVKLIAQERQRALAALPVHFDYRDVDGVSRQACKAREHCLERLALGSPALPVLERAEWPRVRTAYATYFPVLADNSNVGVKFLTKINDTLRKLSKHYDRPTQYNSAVDAPAGDPLAFRIFFREMQRKIPQPLAGVSL